MRRVSRVDANHSEVVQALTRAGAMVVDLSGVGAGVPDILIFHRGRCIPAEIKDGAKSQSRRRLTPDQVIFHRCAMTCGYKIPIVKSVDDALALLSPTTGPEQ